MRPRLGLAALTIIPLLLAADASAPPEGWKEFSPKDKSFTVWMPESGKRTERERTLTVLKQRTKIDLVQVEADGGPTYAASVLIIPATLLRKIPMQQRTEIVLDSFLKEVKGKVADEQDIKQGRVPGKEYQIAMPKGAARLRVFAVGGRVYRASVTGSKEQVESKDSETFLNSYKLPEKATAEKAKPKEK
jgi:hypothetical protein